MTGVTIKTEQKFTLTVADVGKDTSGGEPGKDVPIGDVSVDGLVDDLGLVDHIDVNGHTVEVFTKNGSVATGVFEFDLHADGDPGPDNVDIVEHVVAEVKNRVANVISVSVGPGVDL